MIYIGADGNRLVYDGEWKNGEKFGKGTLYIK